MEYNLIVDSGHVMPNDHKTLFGDEGFDIVPKTMDMWDILVKMSIFSSRGQARKDKYWGQHREMPTGYTELEVGKMRHKFFIWNPTVSY